MFREFLSFDGDVADPNPLLMNAMSPGEEQESPSEPQDPFDDVFGSVPASPTQPGHDGATRSIEHRNAAHPSDIPRLRSLHVTNGYREGIASSKEKYLQAGFDEGYSLGGEIGMKAGICLGTLEGICSALARGGQATDQQIGAISPLTEVEGMEEVFANAREELKMETLLGADYFGPDGLWLYDVPGQGDAEEEMQVTLSTVAASHPVLRKWIGKIEAVSRSLCLDLDIRMAEGTEV